MKFSKTLVLGLLMLLTFIVSTQITTGFSSYTNITQVEETTSITIPLNVQETSTVPSRAWDLNGNKIQDSLEQRSFSEAPVVLSAESFALLEEVINEYSLNVRTSFPAIKAASVNIPSDLLYDLSQDSRILGIEDGALEMHALLDGSLDIEQIPEIYQDYGYNGQGIVIAVIDTGIDNSHMDLDDDDPYNTYKLIAFKDVTDNSNTDLTLPIQGIDDQGHGTHCASIAAGTGEASSGTYRGVAYAAQLVGVKVLDSNGQGTEEGVLAGMQWVIDNKDVYGIDVVSMSLGSNSASALDGTDSISLMADQIMDSGLTLLVAAGNHGYPESLYGYNTIGTPAASQNAITIGSVTNTGSWSSFSNEGPTGDNRIKPDVMAVGSDVMAAKANSGNQYVSYSGTSMATPTAAGIAALLLQAAPDATPYDIKEAFINTAMDKGTTGPDNTYGHGIIQAYDALVYLTDENPVDTIPPTVTVSNPSNGATIVDTVSISFSATDTNGISSYSIKIDGTTVTTSNTYLWDTTAYTDGSHTIVCSATDPSGNVGTKTITVNVANNVVDDGGELTNGVTAYGHMDQTDGADMYWIQVPANTQSMHVVLECGSADFDTYGRAGAQPTTSTYDWRGYTSGGEDNTVANPAAGTYYIMVDWYSGDADYTLIVDLSFSSDDTTAPTVSISNPSNGATVSDTVTISFSANDENGISNYAIAIAGTTVANTNTYSWNTVAYSNGDYIITCSATDPSGNVGTSSITVTVNNIITDDGGLLENGIPANGHMSQADGADMYWLEIDANAESMHVVLECGSADFDTYGKAGAQPTTSSYDWRGYTSGGEDNTVANPAQGTYYIMVDWYSGDADYTLTVTVTYSTSDTTAPTVHINNPSNGATVSDIVSISFTADDENGIASYSIRIGSTTVSSSNTYSWDTTSYSNGQYTITCSATDPSGNTGTSSVTVTVDNVIIDDGGWLDNGVPAYGHMDQADGADMYWIDIDANAQSMRVVLECGSADFDTYGKAGSEPTTSSYDWRGYTSGGEDNTVTSPAEGMYFIMVDYYSGDADYTLTVTVTYSTSDTIPPTVSISNPSNGATVSDTVSISFIASDANGIASYAIKIGSTTVATTNTYSWDTTTYTDGSYTITCSATDPSGNTGTASVTVTVDNEIITDDGGLLTNGEAATGHMDQADGADMYWIEIDENAQSMRVVLECGSADFDTYGKAGAQPTTSSYDWRGYTSGGEDNTVSSPAEGTYYIMVDYYSGDDDYTLTVTVTYGSDPGDGDWGTGGKYAIIMGISNYQSISDLSYCDEDAYDWYQYLTGKGYEVHVFYDGSYTSNMYTSIPTSSGAGSSGKVAYGTEANVRAAIQGLADHAEAGDTVAYITSGHGSGDGNGNSYLCMYDCSGSAGCYYDYELASDIGGFVSGVNIFVFIDHCYSGGMGPELMSLSNSQYIYCTTTCTEDGYGYDDSSHSNGAWTYEFLEKYLVSSPNSSMEAIYDSASASYTHTGGDAAMEFDGNSSSAFYL